MMYKKIFRWGATLGPIGYLPACGSIATLLTQVGLYFFPYTTTLWYVISILALYSIASITITQGFNLYTNNDPKEIIIDEVIGTLVTFCALPISLVSLSIGFILFRFFDISKIGPVGWSEKVKGATGILLDDVVAGFLSAIILHVLAYVW